ncbi:DUF3102 domain-containing protein [Pseudogracilibacillus sp. SO30301A]|uniref:DUF3102 domain-containing protein n=1 Tax=Pseudogracilibacillus sp. SO30301A TaxID=3098291 RepID=UPI003FA6C314
MKENDLAHGNFGGWLDNNFEYSQRYAQEFMKFYNQNPNLNSDLKKLSWTQVRQVMLLPESVDKSEFIKEEHEIPSSGETKTDLYC